MLSFYGGLQRLKGALRKLTTQEGDMWRVDVALTAGESVLQAKSVPLGMVGPTENVGRYF